MSRIIEFLIRAKKATYAGKGAEEAIPTRPNSHDLKYQEDHLLYIDTYLGGGNFAGEEAIWESEMPFWAMNYCGRVLSEKFDGDFLKEALSNATNDMPYRGPKEYNRDNYSYRCTVSGNFEWFIGSEAILYEDVLVYECVFHGGSIE